MIRNVLGYSDGFGDLALGAAITAVLLVGIEVCFHVFWERPRRARQLARGAADGR